MVIRQEDVANHQRKWTRFLADAQENRKGFEQYLQHFDPQQNEQIRSVRSALSYAFVKVWAEKGQNW